MKKVKMKKVKITRIQTVIYEPKPEWYPEEVRNDIDKMIKLDLENDVGELFFDFMNDNDTYTEETTYKIIE